MFYLHYLEFDLSSVLHPLDIGCHYSRIQMDDEVTPETLYNMVEKIGDSAKLLLPNKKMDVLAYACTSASATIGEDKIVHQLSKRQVILVHSLFLKIINFIPRRIYIKLHQLLLL